MKLSRRWTTTIPDDFPRERRAATASLQPDGTARAPGDGDTEADREAQEDARLANQRLQGDRDRGWIFDREHSDAGNLIGARPTLQPRQRQLTRHASRSSCARADARTQDGGASSRCGRFDRECRESFTERLRGWRLG